MKILFVSCLYPKEYIDELRIASNGSLQNAPNVLQWAVVDGLFKCDADFQVVSFPALPAYPMRYKNLHTPSSVISFEDKLIGSMVSYCNLAAYKSYSIQRKLKQRITHWIEQYQSIDNDLVILTYTPNPAYIKAIKSVKVKYPNVKVASIITDLVDDMHNFAVNRKGLKRLQAIIETKQTKQLYRYIDKFILLTKAMEEKIPEASGKSVVIEGISASTNKHCLARVKIMPSNIKTLLYTGTFEEFAGVKDLVDAFMLTTNQNFRLQLCGSGQLTKYIAEASLKDNRIDILGLVSRDRAVELQRQATLLINPRKPNGGITKYSFPSKTMEYMTSGTPMIGYKLEGIPKEYYQYMYIPNDLSVESLSQLIGKTLDFDEDQLNQMANSACKFILKNKTSKIQVAKIISHLKD